MFELRQGKAMRRNKPRQRGVREARPAGGAGRAGGRARGPVVPAQVREEAARDAGHLLPPSFGRAAFRRNFPTQVVLFTNKPTGERFYLLPWCLSLGRHRVPGWGGGARWGGRRAAGGLGRHLAAFWEAGACGEHPQPPAVEPWPAR